MELWYKKPAAYWEEALPLGNGRLGAMVWSGVEQEKISLNEDSLWSGYPQSHDIPGAEKYYEEARRLAREKKYCEAQALIEENVLGQYTQSYLPLGELILDMVHPEGEVSDYRRWLDLEKAMCGLRYSVGNVSYAREAFVSAPDQVMVMRISADKAGKVSLRAGYTCQLRATVSAEDGCMVLDGIAPSQVDPSYVKSEDPVIYEEDPKKKGMRFCAMLTIRQKGGTVRQLPEGLEVMKAWGFQYKTNIIWEKVRKDGGPDGRGVGFYFRNVTEMLLFGVKGANIRTLSPARTQVNLIRSQKREHSRKPDEMIKLIEACSPGPYLELFARGERDGWTLWGNQANESYAPDWPTYSSAEAQAIAL